MKGKFWRSARLPGRGDAAALAVLALAAFFLWNHPDIQETAQHVHILLDDLFSGQFFDFYEHTMQARQAYGFANAAHYHIGFYLLCAVWDLPVYLLGKLVPVSPFVFMLWTKALGVAAWAGCGLLLQTIARRVDAVPVLAVPHFVFHGFVHGPVRQPLPVFSFAGRAVFYGRARLALCAGHGRGHAV